VARLGPVARLTDPADPRLPDEIDALPVHDREALAAAFADQAAQITADPAAERALSGWT
jgi:hypothetical protein